MAIANITNNILTDSGVTTGSLVPNTLTISTTSPLTGGGALSGNLTLAIPAATTSVNGYLTSTDWNTFNSKQSALTNPVTGTGTSGQVTYFNGTSTVTGSNNLNFDGTNLTIGNPSSTLAQLHVYNSSAAASMLLQTNSSTDYGEIAVRNNASTATSYFRQYSTAAVGSDFGISRAGLALFFSNYATNFAIGTRNGGDLILGTADTERARLLASNGYFGIGTSSPSYLLDVNGTLRATGAATFSSSVTAGGNIDIGSNAYLGGLAKISRALVDPATSGSADPNYFTRYVDSAGSRVLDMGVGTSAAWLQSRDKNSYAVNYNLLLNPNGGNVGIGTTSPKTLLSINGGSGAYPTLGTNVTSSLMVARNDNNIGMYIGYASDGNGWIQQMRNDSATAYNLILQPVGGNVGIGTTSPGARLEAYYFGGQTSNLGDNIVLGVGTDGGSIGTFTQIGLGYNNKNAGNYYPAIIASVVENSSGQNAEGIIFATRSATTGTTRPTERMRITSGGNVGIGTTSPNPKLQITGGSFGAYHNSGSSNGAQIYLGDTNFDNASYYNSAPGIGSAYNSTQGVAGDLAFYGYASVAGSRTERMRIQGNTGNVGIGTTSPAAQLEVTSGSSGFRFFTSTSTQAQMNMLADLGLGYDNAAAFFAVKESTNNSYLSFWNKTSGSMTEKMRITSGGNVGIGTTSPTGRLTLQRSGNGAETDIDFLNEVGAGPKAKIRFGGTSEELAFWTGATATEKMRITSGGNVCINATSSSYQFYVNGSAQVGSLNVGSLGTGTVYSSGGTLTNTNPSDRRLKDNITPITYGLNEVLKLNPVSFDWKNDNNKNKQFGFIAQEVQEIMPDAVIQGEYLGLEKDAIYVALVNAIKELKQEIDELKNK